MDNIKELKILFQDNIELGKWANCQALILEVAKVNILEADKLAAELKDVHDAVQEETYDDEQMRHKETPEQDY